MTGKPHKIFITGGTGYMGRRLISELQRRGHDMCALVRSGSEKKLPSGCRYVVGDALKAETYAPHVASADTFVHLIGVPHPSPAKAQQFRAVDLVSVEAAVSAAKQAGGHHFLYLSLARAPPPPDTHTPTHPRGGE